MKKITKLLLTLMLVFSSMTTTLAANDLDYSFYNELFNYVKNNYQTGQSCYFGDFSEPYSSLKADIQNIKNTSKTQEELDERVGSTYGVLRQTCRMMQEEQEYNDTHTNKQPDNSKPVVKEEPKPVVKEKPKPTVKEETKPVVKEKPKPVVKEETKPVVKEKPKPVVKEETKPVVKEKPKPTVKEETKPVVKEEPKTVVKEGIKPVVKEEPKTVVKEEIKPVVKEEPKSVENTVKEEPTIPVEETTTDVSAKTTNKETKPEKTKAPAGTDAKEDIDNKESSENFQTKDAVDTQTKETKDINKEEIKEAQNSLDKKTINIIQISIIISIVALLGAGIFYVVKTRKKIEDIENEEK